MADTRFLQVSINGLKIRVTPAGETVQSGLQRGDIIEVDYDKHVERGGLIWVQHAEGWSAIRPIKLENGQRAYVEDITHEVPASSVMFRVRFSSLNVRQTPNGTPNEYIVIRDDVLIGEKLSQGQPTDGGHIWWQHKLGWTSERSGSIIYMEKLRNISNPRADIVKPLTPLINPAATVTTIPPFGNNGKDDDIDTKAEEVSYFRVTETEGVNIRHSADARSRIVGFADVEQIVAVKTKTPKIAGSYRWLHLTNGNWIAIGRKNSTIDWLEQTDKPEIFDPPMVTRENIHELPLWRSLFTDFPVDFPTENDWFQYFGNTIFAFRRGHDFNYDGYSQGLHGGVDFGNNSQSLDIYARVTGTVVRVTDRWGVTNQVHVQSGSYTIIYLHLTKHSHSDLKDRDDLPYEGQPVTPTTFLGKTLFGPGQPNHLHLEVRYKDNMIVNPLELMSEDAANKIIARYNPKSSFYQSHVWNQWLTPFEQPVIQLRGDVLGPKAK